MKDLPDPELCEKYAQFASHMVRWQFKIIYWTMFFTNLLVLFIASWIYIKGQETLEQLVEQPRKRSKRLKLYIGLCFGCVLISACVTVMEAYSLLALQFCDGEDLMSLYWSTWTMIQVGSLIAIVGIILAMLHSLQNRRHPPWALALGTPVLVIAGFLHLFHGCTMARVDKFRKSKRSSVSTPSPTLVENTRVSTSVSQDSTGDTMVGEFIGFTVDGGPIVRFQSGSANSFDDNAEILGYCDGDRRLVAYRKDSIQFIPETTQTREANEKIVTV